MVDTHWRIWFSTYFKECQFIWIVESKFSCTLDKMRWTKLMCKISTLSTSRKTVFGMGVKPYRIKALKLEITSSLWGLHSTVTCWCSEKDRTNRAIPASILRLQSISILMTRSLTRSIRILARINFKSKSLLARQVQRVSTSLAHCLGLQASSAMSISSMLWQATKLRGAYVDKLYRYSMQRSSQTRLHSMNYPRLQSQTQLDLKVQAKNNSHHRSFRNRDPKSSSSQAAASI